MDILQFYWIINVEILSENDAQKIQTNANLSLIEMNDGMQLIEVISKSATVRLIKK